MKTNDNAKKQNSSDLFEQIRKNNAMRLIDNYHKLLLVLKKFFQIAQN